MKKIVLLLCMVLLFRSSEIMQTFATITPDENSSGVIAVSGDKSIKNLRIKVQKGDNYYVTPILPTKTSYEIPLTFGPGKYTIIKLDLAYQNVYMVKNSETLKVVTIDDLQLYSSSSVFVNYQEKDTPIEYYSELVSDCSYPLEITQKIYQDIITNYSYNHEKSSTIQSSYCSDITETFTEKSGICYDFATLMAATLRQCGVPTKLIIGKFDKMKDLHAWNEVYIGDKWQVVDITVDLDNPSPSMLKSAECYHAIYSY